MTTPSAPRGRAALIERVKGILFRPRAEWPLIAAEPATVGSIYSSYVVYLAAVPVICTAIGSLVFGYSAAGFTVRPSLFGAIETAVVQYALQLGGVYVFALIIGTLAPRFGGVNDRVSALKLAAYSATASWAAGVFALVPALAFLAILGLYSLYLLYTGAPVLMHIRDDKAASFTLAIIGVGILLSIVATMLLAALTPDINPAPDGRMSGKVSLPGVGSVDLSKLDEATKRLSYIAKQMEAGGQGAKQGSEEVPPGLSPITPQQLKAFLPESLPGGYSRERNSSSSSGAGGFTVVTADAFYTKGDASISMTLSDIGAAGALASLGGMFGAFANEETETSYSKFGEVDGRTTMESYDRATGSGSYTVLVGSRVLVEAKGDHAPIADLIAAVHAVNPTKLEALVAAP